MDNYTQLEQAKELKIKWDNCTNDAERIALAASCKQIIFIIDNDNTTCHFNYDPENLTQEQCDEISEAFGCYQLDNDFGNRSGVGTLLNYIGIPFEHC